MKKLSLIFAFCGLLFVGACCRCELEPIVQENHKLIVPPNFGNKPVV
ncbi:MAG: hypothetical protein FWG80_04715 [Alphaproteobacteria bacterium]|nr:hypothetical protein [Alphaproteobacteria bacterium]